MMEKVCKGQHSVKIQTDKTYIYCETSYNIHSSENAVVDASYPMDIDMGMNMVLRRFILTQKFQEEKSHTPAQACYSESTSNLKVVYPSLGHHIQGTFVQSN